MRKNGIFIILPYSVLRDLPQLRISPVGCVPQQERRPRMICDYTYSGVNPQTVKRAPPEAMQWGRTLHRILWYVFTADQGHGPVLLSKTDMSNGFYQLHITPSGALKLAIPFPQAAGQPPLVAIPTRLPMGWTESPPAFSAPTEMGNVPPLLKLPWSIHLQTRFQSTKRAPFVHLLPTWTCMLTTLSRLHRDGSTAYESIELPSMPLTAFLDPMTISMMIESNQSRSRSCSKGMIFGLPKRSSSDGSLIHHPRPSPCLLINASDYSSSSIR